MIKTIAIAAAVIVAIPLVVAAFQPGNFRVERSTSIQAPSGKVHALINDMRAFNTWNPYNLKDPQIRGEYKGPPAGPGAQYHFAGNKDVGKGSIGIIDTTPQRVTMKLDMLEPFEGHNIVEFHLQPQGDKTDVTWAMHGPSPYLAKVVGLFMNMDRMIGRDFEAGLAGLKARAEKPV